ncbi:MAG TPA: FliH/SctL family protein [Acidimicrobiales bacterium]|nr:FliH/SctL family protein [Acidimicrobiales bacterium]
MRWSSEAPRARILKGSVGPFQLYEIPLDRESAASAPPAAAVAQPWDGRERRSGGDVLAAREDGFKQGYEQGRRDAETECGQSRNDLELACSALASAVAQLQKAAGDSFRLAEDEVASLAFGVAEAVLQRELQLAEHPGRDAVARALALLPPRVEVVVRLHPEDAALMASWPDESRNVTLLADPSVQRGGCVAETGSSVVDTQVATALERVRQVLHGDEDIR